MFGNVIYGPFIKRILQRASIKLFCFHLVLLFSFFFSNSSLLYDNFVQNALKFKLKHWSQRQIE